MKKYSPLSATEDAEFSTQPPPTRHIYNKDRRNILQRLLLPVPLIICFFVLLTLWRIIPNPTFFDGKSKSPQLPVGHEKVQDMGKKRVNAGYFVSWGIYARNYNVADIDAEKLTHILYAFANLKDDGEVFLGDSWADIEKQFEGDSWDKPGVNLYGNFKQLGLLKKQYRHLKVSLSIGGWSWSTHFAEVASSPSTRRKFVQSSIGLLNDLGLDGIDVDWEYPKNHHEAKNFVALLAELRSALDIYADSKNETNRYLLTAAMPCGEDKYKIMLLDEMDRYLDIFYLMAYDFEGSWSTHANHQANLYGGNTSADKAVRYYLSQGIAPQKIVLGMPMYGRAFQNTKGLNHPFNGVGDGTWEKGVHDYKRLPPSGAVEYFDESAIASYSYDANTRELITYDTPQVVFHKTSYIKEKGLGGSMFWELSADHPTSHERSLIAVSYKGLGGFDNVDTSQNHLFFPESKYDNVKRGFE